MPRAKRLPPPKIPEITDPVLKHHSDGIANAKSIIRHNEGLIYHHEKEIKKHLVKDMNDVDPDYVTLGTWTCMKSPVGYCFYDSERDPANDECLICGEPDERK